MPNNLDQILREYSAEVIDTVFTYQDDDRKPNQLYSDVQAEEGRVKALIAEAITHIIGNDIYGTQGDLAALQQLRKAQSARMREFLESSNELPKQENSLPN